MGGIFYGSNERRYTTQQSKSEPQSESAEEATRWQGLIELVRKLDKRKQMIILDAVKAGAEALKDGMIIEHVTDKVRRDIKKNLCN